MARRTARTIVLLLARVACVACAGMSRGLVDELIRVEHGVAPEPPS